MRGRKGRRTNDKVGIRAVELQPDFKTIKACLVENIMDDLTFMFKAKRPLYFRHFRLDETAETDVSDQRGRRKTAELHTSGAKRAETWRGG